MSLRRALRILQNPTQPAPRTASNASFARPEERARALFANHCRTHSRRLGTRTVVVNCIHVICISFNGRHAVTGVSYTLLPQRRETGT